MTSATAHLPKVAAAGDLLHYATVREQWERRSQGEGSKGQRAYDWTWFEATLPGQIPADGFAGAGYAPLSPAPRAPHRRPGNGPGPPPGQAYVGAGVGDRRRQGIRAAVRRSVRPTRPAPMAVVSP
ncbi:hypothetical protein ABT121_44500 [Streptomyces sp. NPDC001928]|uniref:hypothetical protein n=1 Tax=Streptomyces sp. NPDC001928 TaxID=3154404 RepID=UPI0033324A7B